MSEGTGRPARLTRREALRFAAASLTLLVSPLKAKAATTVLAVRVWPAEDYTRVTLEYEHPIKYTQILVKDPWRLVVDLEDVEFNSVLQSLPGKISETDPYIRLIRAGRNKPGVIRLVIELKSEVKPQVFTLAPIGEYGHRLVLDLYPVQPVDPLLALLNQAPASPAPAAEAVQPPTERGKAGRERPAARPSVSRMIIVTLDPGHGGEDPGAVGRGGNYEKNVTLSVAQRLRAKLEAEDNMRVVMTRDSDFFVPLGQRVAKARRVQADLFVSIHADAFIKPTARGSSVFVLSDHGASSSAARWLANRENSADLVGGVNINVKDPYLARTLLDLSQTATLSDSLKLGRDVLGELGRINTLHKGQVEQAAFAVLKAPDIPSILVETAFISNPEEEKRLVDEEYQDRIATAILKGIKGYFAKNPPLAKSPQA